MSRTSRRSSLRFRLLLGCLLLSTPFLVGSKCVFIVSSGDDDPTPPKDPNQPTVLVKQGSIAPWSIRGLSYRSAAVSGQTGAGGSFRYEEGVPVRFYLGDIPLGDAVEGRASITLADLVAGGLADSPAVINLARLLLSLDATPGDGVINIPAAVAAQAVAGNPALYWAVESLDFGDDASFDSTASALVATLTRDYPFTASLVDAGTARALLGEAR